MAVESTSNTRGTRKSTATKTARSQPQPKSQSKRTSGTALIDPERRRALIAEAAYFRAERRGFAPGHEAEDWLAAEVEVDTALTVGVPLAGQPAVQ
ncbi:MAG TPA: DUF2934 domain-containing protein [Steroidobacteraceae bacterium]|nr:DUF2934 domain-containing protein [Steroidobacteraceae bacterium]